MSAYIPSLEGRRKQAPAHARRQTFEEKTPRKEDWDYNVGDITSTTLYVGEKVGKETIVGCPAG